MPGILPQFGNGRAFTYKWKVSLPEHRHQLNQEHSSVKKKSIKCIIKYSEGRISYQNHFERPLPLRMSSICTVLREKNESSVLFSVSTFFWWFCLF